MVKQLWLENICLLGLFIGVKRVTHVGNKKILKKILIFCRFPFCWRDGKKNRSETFYIWTEEIFHTFYFWKSLVMKSIKAFFFTNTRFSTYFLDFTPILFCSILVFLILFSLLLFFFINMISFHTIFRFLNNVFLYFTYR